MMIGNMHFFKEYYICRENLHARYLFRERVSVPFISE